MKEKVSCTLMIQTGHKHCWVKFQPLSPVLHDVYSGPPSVTHGEQDDEFLCSTISAKLVNTKNLEPYTAHVVTGVPLSAGRPGSQSIKTQRTRQGRGESHWRRVVKDWKRHVWSHTEHQEQLRDMDLQ